MSDQPINPATLAFIRDQQAKQKKSRRIASVAGLLIVATIATGGYFGWQKYRQNKSEAALKALVADVRPGNRAGFEKLRQAIDTGVINGRDAFQAMRDAREAEEQKRVDGFFKTPVVDRDKYLDQLIDEQQKRMQEWQRNRPTTAPATRPQWNREGRGPATRPTEAQRAEAGRARADNTSPLQRAQRGEFGAAMQARMKERGIQGGGWGGGGGRGPGGGGGGRGPGGGGGGGR